MLVNKVFYIVKPFIPRRLQLQIRRLIIRYKMKRCQSVWPIDEKAKKQPDGWKGWPEGKRFALVLTHDVDTAKGQERCIELAQMEERLGFSSSFNFVPERYRTLPEVREYLNSKGFEIGVHGLYHDGKYFNTREEFQKRAIKINHYLKEWNAVGYRSPSMLHNLERFLDLNIEYDASTFDTDPFEPQSDGMGTIFPFRVRDNGSQKGYVELPYTLPQDSTLFILMKGKNIHIWKKKLDWIAEHGGMALLNVHPDYMNFNGGRLGIEEYPAQYYEEFLNYIKSKYKGQYWHVLPRDIARFWSENSKKDD